MLQHHKFVDSTILASGDDLHLPILYDINPSFLQNMNQVL